MHTNGRMPKHQVCLIFEAPDSSSSLARARGHARLGRPGHGREPHGRRCLAREGLTAVLRVPSVVFDVERNVLINPGHADFRRIKLVGTEPVRWDERLFTEKPRS